ncbi:MAG TPA: hydroxyphenylacetyl-CoA thioesterase PaaI [Galbitalea sp.]|jgi:acyl-CoA thioesterase|nr:hydroxyphenylacetyl-CoA thioesterase PaaI [Galbitalea sp.]
MSTEQTRTGIGMMKRDRASEGLGMVVEVNEPGHSVVRMPIRDDMLNGFLITHGGFVFAVADTAFAIACNDNDVVTVAAGADVTFLATTTVGDVLTATAKVRATAGRSGIYDVQVTNQHGTVIAEFRGRSRRTNLPLPISD